MNRIAFGVALLGVALLPVGCSTKGSDAEPAPIGERLEAPGPKTPSPPSPGNADRINPRLLRRFQPLSATSGSGSNPAIIALGRMLFFDPRLSVAGDISCNTCHDLPNYGVDGRPTSIGHKQRHGTRNAPTVYNAAGFFAQFWDGRAATLEEQARGPLLNPAEMAMPDTQHVASAVKRIPGYGARFREAFPGVAEPITYDRIVEAISAFERVLVTPGRWDRYLKGDEQALSSAEKHGLKTFLDVGCMVCHTGPYLGGSMFERVGVVEAWPNQTDRGRGAVTHVAADDMMFRVPTLRNIAKTGPYFHDGSVSNLAEAVHMMGKHQLGLDLSDDEVASIVTWLNSLTSQLPAEYIAKPELPSSG